MSTSKRTHTISYTCSCGQEHELDVEVETTRYIYGADADGNRGELRNEQSILSISCNGFDLDLGDLDLDLVEEQLDNLGD